MVTKEKTKEEGDKAPTIALRVENQNEVANPKYEKKLQKQIIEREKKADEWFLEGCTQIDVLNLSGAHEAFEKAAELDNKYNDMWESKPGYYAEEEVARLVFWWEKCFNGLGAICQEAYYEGYYETRKVHVWHGPEVSGIYWPFLIDMLQNKSNIYRDLGEKKAALIAEQAEEWLLMSIGFVRSAGRRLVL